MHDKLYIILLNWNGEQDTIECLVSIKKSSYAQYRIVLVDNGSKIESLLKLKSWCNVNFNTIIYYNRQEAETGGTPTSESNINNIPSSKKLVFIENSENLGFAAGNNVALRYALQSKAQYTLLLNNDTVIEKDSIAVLVNFMDSNREYVAVTPQIRYYNPNDRIWNCGGKIMWFGNRKYYFPDEHISKVPQKGFTDITFITGCALLFKPQTTGILTEKFFFGEEDLDFSFRQKKNCNKMACCFSSIIYHKVNSSVTKLNFNNIGYIYLHYLSRLINNKYHASTCKFIIVVFVNLIYAVPMIKMRYRYSFKTIFRMIFTILSELHKFDSIDKKMSLNCLKEDFSQPLRFF